MKKLAKTLKIELDFFQSSHEGEIVENDELGPSPHYLQSTWILFYDSTCSGKPRSGATEWAKVIRSRLLCSISALSCVIFDIVSRLLRDLIIVIPSFAS